MSSATLSSVFCITQPTPSVRSFPDRQNGLLTKVFIGLHLYFPLGHLVLGILYTNVDDH
jgi:hypothetical protein